MTIARSNFLFWVTLLVILSTVLHSELLPAQKRPLKVFILVGQSNMQGHAHVRTLPHLGMDESTKPLLAEIVDPSGKPKVIKDVWISYLSSKGEKSGKLTTGFGADDDKMGPELTFGIYMQKKIGEPILIIKCAWGGKSINTDFRSPSAGPYKFSEKTLQQFEKQGKNIQAIKQAKAKATGVFYRKTIDHIQKVLANIENHYPDFEKENGYQLSGLVWFQGWNDMVDRGTYPNRDQANGYADYSVVLEHLIDDFRKDLNAPQMPFIVGVMGVNGPTSKYTGGQKRYQKIHQNFRDAMAAPAKSKKYAKNTFNVFTENAWDLELESLINRDNQIRSKINRSKKDNQLQKTIKELDAEEKLTDLDKENLAEIKNNNQLAKAIIEILQKKEFTDQERRALNTGKSNAAFHYLGSSKIMAKIGKMFAESIPVPPNQNQK